MTTMRKAGARTVTAADAAMRVGAAAERHCFVIVDDNPARAALIQAGLRDISAAGVVHAASLDIIAHDLDRREPIAMLVSCDRCDHNMLERLRAVFARRPCPIVLFAESIAGDLSKEAIAAGVAALVIDGLTEKRVKPVVEIALVRFRSIQALQQELERARSDLAARKVIERAKGILMERKQMSEAEAYGVLRRSAMEDGKTIAEIAEAVISVNRLLAV